LSDDPREAAKDAGLRYVSDETIPGVTRHGAPGRFYYRLPSGARLTDSVRLRRIRALAIPPAWTDVWIAPFENAHLVATGRDAKSRKQYRYHPDFAAIRDAAKYEHLAEFAQGLPRLRRRLKADLARSGLPREKILAAIVTLLEETLIRVGNEDYARANGSFGLTTLRNRHVKVKGAHLAFLFKGKSGKIWNLSFQDRRVARVIRSCQELPGQHLFEYRDPEGAVHAVSSTDVNAYLREISGREISAKDFRTWAGTVEAALAFAAFEGEPSKRAVRGVIAAVAERLGNTVAVCRKCYVHPVVISGFETGTLHLTANERPGGLNAAERSVLSFLQKASPRKSALRRRTRAKAAGAP
jgi:DNA topoisomerase-1